MCMYSYVSLCNLENKILFFEKIFHKMDSTRKIEQKISYEIFAYLKNWRSYAH